MIMRLDHVVNEDYLLMCLMEWWLQLDGVECGCGLTVSGYMFLLVGMDNCTAPSAVCNWIYMYIFSQLHPLNGLFEQEKLIVLHFVHLLGKYFIYPSTQMESPLDPSNALFE